MNNVLLFKGSFQSAKNRSGGGSITLKKDEVFNVQSMDDRLEELKEIYHFFEGETYIHGALVSVQYKSIVAKSNRCQIFLAKGSRSPSESVVGAKFVTSHHMKKHAFTHFVHLETLLRTIKLLQCVRDIIAKDYSGAITSEQFNALYKDYSYDQKITKSNFKKVLFDLSHVESFYINESDLRSVNGMQLVTLYETEQDPVDLLKQFGIKIDRRKMIDHTTVYMYENEARQLSEKAPYLISMSLNDFSTLDTLDDEITSNREEDLPIPHPTNEPVIGVIDTLFNENVYFHEWVEFHNMLSPDIPVSAIDRHHGTAVDSIIVDGPKGNPSLEDHCGRFRVRHFGVLGHDQVSSFTFIKQLRQIIDDNQDIKVWNLSLGSIGEIHDNYISAEAAIIDELQNEYDVIFVISGTNKKRNSNDSAKKIGAPADSLNAIVVNSVGFDGKPASYTRTGPVLSFFNKPDVCYYGGEAGHDIHKKIIVCTDFGGEGVCGTSFAAPWITRKTAFLIYKMGLSREAAKALIIDAAASWSTSSVSPEMGYGIVPIDINDIIHTKDDEMKFILQGVTNQYETYSYELPVPIVDEKYPYFSRAVLTYFSKGDRSQGVDYTSTELDLHLGRLKEEKEVPKILSLDGNKQADRGFLNLSEESARKIYRKWDNVKRIFDAPKEKARPKMAYQTRRWGIKIYKKGRTSNADGTLTFAVVVTLKEMNGVNRIDDFIKSCELRNWLVTELDVETRLDIYNKQEEEIDFD